MVVKFPSLLGRVYVDTAPLVYTIEAHRPYLELLTPFWVDVDAGRCIAISSALSLTEALIMPIRRRDVPLQRFYRRTLEGTRLILEPISNDVLIEAAAIRAAYRGVRTPDAIHGATAHLSGCTTFISNDRKLAWVSRLYSIRFIYLKSLLCP